MTFESSSPLFFLKASPPITMLPFSSQPALLGYCHGACQGKRIFRVRGAFFFKLSPLCQHFESGPQSPHPKHHTSKPQTQNQTPTLNPRRAVMLRCRLQFPPSGPTRRTLLRAARDPRQTRSAGRMPEKKKNFVVKGLGLGGRPQADRHAALVESFFWNHGITNISNQGLGSP